jgi:hypothetical protein
MMTLLCTDQMTTAAVFYEMFHLFQGLGVQLILNTVQLEFPEDGTDRVLSIILYLHQHYSPLDEKNSFHSGLLYSTTCWVKGTIPVKRY